MRRKQRALPSDRGEKQRKTLKEISPNAHAENGEDDIFNDEMIEWQ